jgi:hypothetical protein
MTRSRLLAAIIAAVVLGLAACGGAATSSHPASHRPTGAAGSALSPPPSAPAQPARTQVIAYAPWSSAGALASGISAVSTQSGACFSTSSATTAPGAYRCAVGNLLYDPCFADATSGAGEVACPVPDNPDSVVVIKLTSPLPAPATSPGFPIIPWLLVLANGQECGTITGTGGILGGKDESYGCSGGSVYGLPNQNEATWQVTYAPSGAPASAMTQVAVTKAYE